MGSHSHNQDEVDKIRRRLREDYYNRKVARAEQILPYLFWLCVGAFFYVIGYSGYMMLFGPD